MNSTNSAMKYCPLVARTLIASLFIISGSQMALNFSGTTGFVGSVVGVSGILATLVTALVILIKVGGGLMVASGFRAAWGAWALILFTAGTIALVHNNMADLTQALKNLSIIGGLLMVTIYGCGQKKTSTESAPVIA